MNINKRKRIAIVLPDLSVIGAQRYAIKVAENLMARGYDIHILVFYKEGGFLREVPTKNISAFRMRADLMKNFSMTAIG